MFLVRQILICHQSDGDIHVIDLLTEVSGYDLLSSAGQFIKVQQAHAEGIRLIKEAGADESVLTIKSLEAFEKAADGQATKIIVPSNIAESAGVIKALVETVKDK